MSARKNVAEENLLGELEAALSAADTALGKLSTAQIWAGHFGMIRDVDRVRDEFGKLPDRIIALKALAKTKAKVRRERRRS